MATSKIPTPIVDKNGKQTTVHKNPEKMLKPGRSLPPVRSFDDLAAEAESDGKVLFLDEMSAGWDTKPSVHPEVVDAIRNQFPNFDRLAGEDDAREYVDDSTADFITTDGGYYVVMSDYDVKWAVVNDLEEGNRAGFLNPELLSDVTGIDRAEFEELTSDPDVEAHDEVLALIMANMDTTEFVDKAIQNHPTFRADWFAAEDETEHKIATPDGFDLYAYRRR